MPPGSWNTSVSKRRPNGSGPKGPAFLRQYDKLKAEYPATVLAFRIDGVFWFFSGDAEAVQEVAPDSSARLDFDAGPTIRGAKLTAKEAERVLGRILASGKKVAIVEGGHE